MISPTFGNPETSTRRSSVKLPENPKWAVGVTTCARPEPTLERTVDSLLRAGWNEIDVFCDGSLGHAYFPKNFFDDPARKDVRTHDRPTRLGAYGAFVCAAAELFQTHSDSELFLFVQDDVICCENLRRYVEKTIDPTKGVVWSAYCSGTDYDLIRSSGNLLPGWRPTNRGWGMMGALFVVFTKRDLISFLSSSSTWLHRVTRGAKATKQVDAEIGLWAQNVGMPAMFHHPSLCQHIGETSSIYALQEMSDRRSSPTFVGEAANALDFLKGEGRAVEKFEAIGVDPGRPDNAPENLRIGVYGSLGLNAVGYATARLLDIDRVCTVLCVDEPGFPMAAGSYEQPVTYCAVGSSKSKVALGLSKANVVFATKPMSSVALSYCKAKDIRIVSFLFNFPGDITDAWGPTLRNSDLIVSPGSTEEDIVKAATKGWNITNYYPDVFVDKEVDYAKMDVGFWRCGSDGKLIDQYANSAESRAMVFTNSVEQARKAIPKASYFDLTKADHDSLFQSVSMMKDIVFPANGINWFALTVVPTYFQDRTISVATLPTFLKEKMKRFRHGQA